MDKLIMLLSADWFFPYWIAIGITASERTKVCVRYGCRRIVREIVGDAKEYYHISFAPERLQSTSDRFERVLKDCKLDEISRNEVTRLIPREGQEGSESEAIKWILYCLTQRLVADDMDSDASCLDSTVRQIVADAHLKFEHGSVNLQAFCLTSTTDWDRYLRQLTPGLPTSVADYASETLIAGSIFEHIWNYASVVLTPKQKSDLLEWYRKTARDIMGVDSSSWPSPWGIRG